MECSNTCPFHCRMILMCFPQNKVVKSTSSTSISTTMTENTITKKKKKGFKSSIKIHCETCGEGCVSLDALRYHRATVHDPYITIKGHKGTIILV